MPCSFLNSSRRPVVEISLRPDSDVMSLGDQRRSGLTVGTSLSPGVLIPFSADVDTGLDPRYDIRFSKLDLAAEYIERRQSFLANQEAQKLAAQAAADKAAADGDLPAPPPSN